MLLLNKCITIFGQDMTAYFMVILSSILWVGGFMIGSQNLKINFAYVGLTRSIFMIIFTYIVCTLYQIPRHVVKSEEKILMIRNLLACTQGICLPFVLKYLQSPTVYTIGSLGPVFVFLIDNYKNSTPILRKQKSGIFFAMLGMVLAINSNLIMHQLGYQVQLSTKFTYIPTTMEIKGLIALVFLLSTFGYSYSVVKTKQLIQTRSLQINFHVGVLLLISNSLLGLAFPNPGQLNIIQTLYLCILIGSLLSLASVLFVGAIKTSKKSGNITLMTYSNVIASYLISMIRYGEQPNVVGMIGSISIFIGLVRILLK